MKVKCPECGAEIEVAEDAIVGEIISCPDCGLELEIVKIEGSKIEVKSVQVAGEDWGE